MILDGREGGCSAHGQSEPFLPSNKTLNKYLREYMDLCEKDGGEGVVANSHTGSLEERSGLSLRVCVHGYA